jgi:hypothetical protein
MSHYTKSHVDGAAGKITCVRCYEDKVWADECIRMSNLLGHGELIDESEAMELLGHKAVMFQGWMCSARGKYFMVRGFV